MDGAPGAIGCLKIIAKAILMILWWKRLLYSLLSVILSGYVIGVAVILPSAAASKDPLYLIIPPLMVSFVALSGWVVAIPIVLLVRTYERPRVWFYLVLGSLIGPMLVLGTAGYYTLTDPRAGPFMQGSFSILVAATSVSVLTTILYLLFVTRKKRDVLSGG